MRSFLLISALVAVLMTFGLHIVALPVDGLLQAQPHYEQDTAVDPASYRRDVDLANGKRGLGSIFTKIIPIVTDVLKNTRGAIKNVVKDTGDIVTGAGSSAVGKGKELFDKGKEVVKGAGGTIKIDKPKDQPNINLPKDKSKEKLEHGKPKKELKLKEEAKPKEDAKPKDEKPKEEPKPKQEANPKKLPKPKEELKPGDDKSKNTPQVKPPKHAPQHGPKNPVDPKAPPKDEGKDPKSDPKADSKTQSTKDKPNGWKDTAVNLGADAVLGGGSNPGSQPNGQSGKPGQRACKPSDPASCTLPGAKDGNDAVIPAGAGHPSPLGSPKPGGRKGAKETKLKGQQDMSQGPGPRIQETMKTPPGAGIKDGLKWQGTKNLQQPQEDKKAKPSTSEGPARSTKPGEQHKQLADPAPQKEPGRTESNQGDNASSEYGRPFQGSTPPQEHTPLQGHTPPQGTHGEVKTSGKGGENGNKKDSSNSVKGGNNREANGNEKKESWARRHRSELTAAGVDAVVGGVTDLGSAAFAQKLDQGPAQTQIVGPVPVCQVGSEGCGIQNPGEEKKDPEPGKAGAPAGEQQKNLAAQGGGDGEKQKEVGGQKHEGGQKPQEGAKRPENQRDRGTSQKQGGKPEGEGNKGQGQNGGAPGQPQGQRNRAVLEARRDMFDWDATADKVLRYGLPTLYRPAAVNAIARRQEVKRSLREAVDHFLYARREAAQIQEDAVF